jgi:predicted dehydrogenase
MYRHHPRHRRVRELVAARGEIGETHLVEVSFSYFLEDLSNIRLRPERLGGALLDIGCYGIDLARLVLADEPAEVTARCVRGAASGVDELTAVTLTFPSGAMATVAVSSHLARFHEYRVRGTHGVIIVPTAFTPRDHEPTTIIIESASAERRVEEYAPFAAYEAEIAHFAAAVRAGDESLLPPMEDGVANAAVLEAAVRSMGEGFLAGSRSRRM